VLLQALTTATQVMSIGGRNRQAIKAAERGLELERRVPEAATPWSHLLLEAGRCGGYALAGHLDEATVLAQEGYQETLAQRWPLGTALFAMWLGHVNRIRGRPRTALRWLREAAAATEPEGAKPFFLPAILGNLTMAAVLVGDLPAAEAAQAAAKDSLSASSRLFETVPAISQSWVTAARGETSRAVDLAMTAAELAGSRGQLQMRMVALHDVVRLDAARLVADQLDETAANTEGVLAPVYAAHGRSLAGGDAPGLDAAAARFAEIGALLFAAEAATHAARAHRASGSLSSAVAADNRARAWAQKCEDARTPALDLPSQPRFLTSRETEIARMAATGLTSRIIAERLVVSIRTVDNVLHGVYAKLGITGRHELADVIGLVSIRSD
jgi:DNA-binding CsgD family transcriptional regulator